MDKKQLNLQEIERLQQRLEEENHEDEVTYLMGLMGKPEMIERTVRREVERRWLAMEALLLRHGKTHIVH